MEVSAAKTQLLPNRQSSIFDVQVSLFYPMRAKEKSPTPLRNINLADWLFKTNTALLQHQANVRSATSKDAKRRLKNAFYAIVPTGTYIRQGDVELSEFSGFISIDVDDMDANDAKSILGALDFVAYAGESVSGNGVWALVRIGGVDDFKARFAALNKRLAEAGVEIDSSCSNVSRFRCYSYDENAYVNPNASVFDEKYFEPVRERVVRSGDDFRLDTLIRLVCELGVDITGDRMQWMKIGTALACKYGEGGRDTFHGLSRFYSGYSERECDAMFDSVLRGGKKVDVDIIFLAAKNAGVMLK